MLLDITIDPKTHIASLSFELKNFQGPLDFKNALAITFMVAGDYALDPEIEISDLEELVAKGQQEEKSMIIININEEEIEVEFK